MTTTELIRPPGGDRAAASLPPSFGEMLDETIPLIGVIPVAGPAVVFLAGPWLLLVLALVGYVALTLTVAALLVAAVAAVRLVRELVVAPFRLGRDLRTFRTGHRPMPAPAVRVVA